MRSEVLRSKTWTGWQGWWPGCRIFHVDRRSSGCGTHVVRNQRKRVTNWPEYDTALLSRGSLTVWFTEEAGAAWHAPATGQLDGQPIYSAIAIETSLALRLVFHQLLRLTEGLLRSIADLLGINVAIANHTTLSRRGGIDVRRCWRRLRITGFL
jgi:hypothetical protein